MGCESRECPTSLVHHPLILRFLPRVGRYEGTDGRHSQPPLHPHPLPPRGDSRQLAVCVRHHHAYAPTGQRWSDAENAAADQKLSAEIEALGAWRLRITGYSPDTGHAEPGWAVELPIEKGRGIGRQFKQDAIFVIRADALGYVRCEADGKVAWFGAFRERVDVAVQ